jgi:hypothetical protein
MTCSFVSNKFACITYTTTYMSKGQQHASRATAAAAHIDCSGGAQAEELVEAVRPGSCYLLVLSF